MFIAVPKSITYLSSVIATSLFSKCIRVMFQSNSPFFFLSLFLGNAHQPWMSPSVWELDWARVTCAMLCMAVIPSLRLRRRSGSCFPTVSESNSEQMSLMNNIWKHIKNLISFSAVIEPIPMGDAAKDYLSRYVSPTLLTGLTELCKKKPMDPFVSVSLHKSIQKIIL